MARWSINSLFRGIYYYTFAILALLYVVITALFKHTVWWVYRRQAQRRNWHGLADLPPYKHQRIEENGDISKNLVRSHTNDLLSKGKYWGIDNVPTERKTLITRDGLEITYYVMYPGNPRLMVLCNGLGVNANYTGFLPVIYRYGKVGGDYSFITWDYRGLFNNGPVKRTRRLAIHYHAEDLSLIIEKENYKKIDVLFGFSLGVQVALEFVVANPTEKVDKLVLLNGTYGNVMSTLYQPLFRIPFAETLIYQGTLLVTSQIPLLVFLTRNIGYYQALALGHVYSFFLGSPFLRELLGPRYLVNFFVQYLTDQIASQQHAENYMRMVTEMNAHSVYHHLKDIAQPTLIVTGLLDVFTPAYLAFEMARMIPNSKLFCSPLSSHFTLLEQPRQTLGELIALIEGDNTEWLRVNSKDFNRYKEKHKKQEHPQQGDSNSSVSKLSSNGTSRSSK